MTGTYFVRNTVTGMPKEDTFWLMDAIVEGWKSLYLVARSMSGGLAGLYSIKRTNNDWSQKWVQLATTEPPSVFNLPVAEGFRVTSSAQYWKDSQREVTATFRVDTTAEIPAGKKVMAVLPAGFRPEKYAHAAGIVYTSGNPVLLVIDASGSLAVHTSQIIPAGAAVCGTMNFAAHSNP